MPDDLVKIRKSKGMSVGQLASKTGIAVRLIREYEAGTRPIPDTDLRRLARALYVEEWDINARSSSPRKGQAGRDRQPRRPQEPEEAGPAPKAAPSRSPAARETQIAHLLQLAANAGLDRAALEAQVGKPLDQLTRSEARHWNAHFMIQIAESRPPKRPIDRRRAYLPEGVDEFEMEYLEEVKASGERLTFTLFSGERFEGALIGYGPYALTVRQVDGSELTLNKLAIAYYLRGGGAG
jgi:transcriptional regulator with XRE-family HTH domain